MILFMVLLQDYNKMLANTHFAFYYLSEKLTVMFVLNLAWRQVSAL